MRRFSFLIVLLLTIAVAPAKEVSRIVECGNQVTISAHPVSGFHFVRWNDDSTDSIRTVEIYQDVTFTAYFAPNCDEYAELPLVNRYDWVLMINARQIIQDMHYDISPELVHWYRVEGEVDNLNNPDPADPADHYLGEGYSFTLDQNLQQTGIYYATVQIPSERTLYCSGLARTQLAYFAAPEPARNIRLLPNTTTPNGTMRLVGLNPTIQTEIRVYSVTGKLLLQTQTIGLEEYLLTAHPSTGVYEVQVLSAEDHIVLRYLVQQ